MARPDITLAEVLQIAQDLHRARTALRADWDARKQDIAGAWGDGTLTDRARVVTLGPLSLAEHGAKRAVGATSIGLLKPALSLALRSLRGGPETTSYGRTLAEDVSNALVAKLRPLPGGGEVSGLQNIHKFHCGTGLFCERRDDAVSFRYCHVEDGWDATPILTFASQDAFVDWLSAQSDLSLSGVVGPPPLKDWDKMGNQRLTRSRLIAFVGYN